MVLTNHTSKNGETKLVKKCTYPITSTRQVDMIITELAVFEFREGKLILKELTLGTTLREVKDKTAATFYLDEGFTEDEKEMA